jgi:hypothetical protein
MKKVIHRIKNRPEEERRHILNIFVLVVALILFVFWVYSLGRTVTNDSIEENIADDFNSLAPLESNTSIPDVW